MEHIICYQYKIAGANCFFTPKDMDGQSYGIDEGDKIYYLALCICAWKIKQ